MTTYSTDYDLPPDEGTGCFHGVAEDDVCTVCDAAPEAPEKPLQHAPLLANTVLVNRPDDGHVPDPRFTKRERSNA